jgi:hypothetical protein
MLYAHTNVPFSVVVVAGGAPPSARRRLLELQENKDNIGVVLVDHLVNQCEARNIFLQHVTERYCVLLENDTIVHEGWLPPLIDCMREEQAAVVSPLILSSIDETVHAAGGMFSERENNGVLEFQYGVLEQGINRSEFAIERRRIPYPETHCILLDRRQLPDRALFEDVEPFDADLGLTLRKRGLVAFVEPRSLATYELPPPLHVDDVEAFKFRWDFAAWSDSNRRFMRKWNVTCAASEKEIAYRRQQLKLGFARWYPNRLTVGLFNLIVPLVRSLRARVILSRRARHLT